MKTNNTENQFNVTTLSGPSPHEKHSVTALRTHEDAPKLVVPNENTATLTCRYLPDSTIADLEILEPAIWQDSFEVNFNSNASIGAEKGPLTFVRFAWTDEYLLFYVEVERAEKEIILSNDKVWTGSNVEFLISPRWYDRPLYDEYEFLFNSQGGYNDLHWRNGCNLEEALSRNSTGIKWQKRQGLFYHKHLQGWSMMGKIPFSDFEELTPQAGSYWGLGLFRKSFTCKGEPFLQAWSPPLNDPPRFHTPSRFGMLIFRKD